MKPTSDILFTPSVINHIGRTEYFVIPVYTDNKPIGLIHIDRSINKKPLTEEGLNGTKHFSRQANIGLALYKAAGNKKI